MSDITLPVDLTMDLCIKCNICTTACPVSAVTDKFPGPKYEGPQGARFRDPEERSPDHSVDYCSGCRVCNMVCPTGVRIAELNGRARAVMVSQNKFSPVTRLRNNLLGRSELMGQVGHPVAPLANAVLSNGPLRFAAEKVLGIAREAPLPSYSQGGTFREWFDRHPRPENAWRKIVYFHACSTQYFEPRVGRAAVNVLEANGFEVIVPDQNCCGLPLLSNGEFAGASRYHHSNVRHLSGYARLGYKVVGTSTSCTLTLKEEARELLDLHDEGTLSLAEATYDINELIMDLLDEGTLNTDFRPLPEKLRGVAIPYHIPCQYRAHRIGSPGTDVLSLIPGLTVQESQAACCGVAGTYGYKSEKYDIAMDVGSPLFDFVKQSGAPLSICDSETCRWQIVHGTGIPSVHPVELLALAYGFPAEGPLAELLQA